MARGSDNVMNGFLLGALVGVLAYYGASSLPFIGTSIGTVLKSTLDSIGNSILNYVWKGASSGILAYAGALTSILIGGIIGIYVDTR